MFEIRIDAMVRRIGSKPPGTNSIVSLSIRHLPFLVAEISEAATWLGPEDLADRLARQIATLQQRDRDGAERIALPSDPFVRAHL
jgi:hypothetical protein